MTNGFVAPAQVAAVAGGGDTVIVVKYPQGEQRIAVTSSTHLVRNANGSHNPHEAMTIEDFLDALGILTRWMAETVVSDSIQ